MFPPSGIWTYFDEKRNRAVMEAVRILCSGGPTSSPTTDRSAGDVSSSTLGSTARRGDPRLPAARRRLGERSARGLQTTAALLTGAGFRSRRGYSAEQRAAQAYRGTSSRATSSSRASGSSSSRASGSSSSRASGSSSSRAVLSVRAAGDRRARDDGRALPTSFRAAEVSSLESSNDRRTAAGSLDAAVEKVEVPTHRHEDVEEEAGSASTGSADANRGVKPGGGGRREGSNDGGGGNGVPVISDEMEHLLNLYENQQHSTAAKISAEEDDDPMAKEKSIVDEAEEETNLMKKILNLWRQQRNRQSSSPHVETDSSVLSAPSPGRTEGASFSGATSAESAAAATTSSVGMKVIEMLSDASDEETLERSGLPLYLLVESPLRIVAGIWRLSTSKRGGATEVNERYHYVKKAGLPSRLSDLDIREFLQTTTEDIGKYRQMHWDPSGQWVISDILGGGGRQTPEWAAYTAGSKRTPPATAMWWQWDGQKQKGTKAKITSVSSVDQLQAVLDTRQQPNINLMGTRGGKAVEASFEELATQEEEAPSKAPLLQEEEEEENAGAAGEEQSGGGGLTAGVIPLNVLQRSGETDWTDDGFVDLSAMEGDSIEKVAKVLQSYIDSVIDRRWASTSGSIATTTTVAPTVSTSTAPLATTTTTPTTPSTRTAPTTASSTIAVQEKTKSDQTSEEEEKDDATTTTTPIAIVTTTTTSTTRITHAPTFSAKTKTTTTTVSNLPTTTTATATEGTTTGRPRASRTTKSTTTTRGTTTTTDSTTTTSIPTTTTDSTTTTRKTATTTDSTTTTTKTTTASSSSGTRVESTHKMTDLLGMKTEEMQTSTEELSSDLMSQSSTLSSSPSGRAAPLSQGLASAQVAPSASKSSPSVLFIFGGTGEVGRLVNGIYVRTASHSAHPVYRLVPLPHPPLSNNDQPREKRAPLDLYYLDRLGVWAIGYRDVNWEDGVVAFVPSVQSTPVNVRGGAMTYVHSEEEGRGIPEWTVWNGSGQRDRQRILVSAVSSLYYPELMGFLKTVQRED
eukprot:GHVS01005644.1.p1 GENE.GHVS01005644.1~~GHVS01005644.1.p1  ORF type:complete len:1026 (-),score=279.96 GHVS01005644.1:267-3344(-)